MKKIISKIHIYKVLPPYKNWYSIMTDDGLNRNNIIFNRRTTVSKFKSVQI